MEIYSNASTARINFRLSFARPPTNLPLHDRDLARPPPKCPPLLRIFAPLSANDLQRRWHQGLPPIRIVPTSRSSLSFFLFILFYSSSPGAFYSRPASTRLFRVILLRQKPAWILCTCTNVSFDLFARGKHSNGKDWLLLRASFVREREERISQGNSGYEFYVVDDKR